MTIASSSERLELLRKFPSCLAHSLAVLNVTVILFFVSHPETLQYMALSHFEELRISKSVYGEHAFFIVILSLAFAISVSRNGILQLLFVVIWF
ncbi:MAG: hypothetical protein MHMPM18_004694 [Marteilia pararefringens]